MNGVSSDGSWDCGCVYGQYTEADLMLAIGKVAAARLRDLGFTVMTDADTGMAACIFETGGICTDIGLLTNASAFGEVVAQDIYDWF